MAKGREKKRGHDGPRRGSLRRRLRRPAPMTPAPSRCWRGWSRCASGRACTSAAPTSGRCTIWSPRCSTTPWTRRWPATPTASRSSSHADFSLTVRDNGRGMPVDPHPRFPGKSALEVILCTLHAGGKFSGKAYQTSRRPARRRRLGGQRAFRPAGRRGGARPPALAPVLLPRPPARAAAGARAGAEPARHHRHLPPRPGDLRRLARTSAGAAAADGAVQGLPLLRRRDPLALRARVPAAGDDTPEAATFHFPGGLVRLSRPSGSRARSATPTAPSPARSSSPSASGPAPSARSSGRSTGRRSATPSSPPTATPSRRPEGGTHEAGFWAAILKGMRAYGEFASNRKAAQITRDDVMAGGLGDDLGLHPRPRVRRPDQGPAGHPGGRAAGRGRGARPLRQLAGRGHPHRRGDPRLPRPEGRGAAERRAEKETQRKTAVKKLRLPGKLADCSGRDRATARSSSSSRATARAARPSRRGTARPRRCCRCGARS